MSLSNKPAKGTLQFMQFQKPRLMIGKYRLSARQSIFQHTDIEDGWSASQTFYIAGNRFSFPEGTVHSVYPPDKGRGTYDDCLPSLVMNRVTLPWQRSPLKEPSNASWLTVLLVEESEIQAGVVAENQGPVSDIIKDLPNSTLGPEDNPDESVSWLSVQSAWLKQVLPSFESLQYLSHTRINQTENNSSQFAILLGNRIPAPGSLNRAYVISLDQAFDSDRQFVGQGKPEIILPVLHTWRFSCLNDQAYKITKQALSTLKSKHLFYEQLKDFTNQFFTSTTQLKTFLTEQKIPDSKIREIGQLCRFPEATFRGLLMKMNTAPALLNTGQTVSNPNAQTYLDIGAVALKHHLRQGGETVSWYRGPLTASASLDSKIIGKIDSLLIDPAKKRLAETADALLLFNKDLGMFDTTYAAAFEIGRQLGIASQSFSEAFLTWKQAVSQAQALQIQPRAPHQTSTPLASVPKMTSLLLKQLEAWKRLEGIPFNYLVPEEAMLPTESLRFFRVDNVWLRCFLTGIFNLGKTGGNFIAALQTIFPTKMVSGFLLRSEIVSGWPDLQADAFVQAEDNLDPVNDSPLEPIRLERLSTNVLIGLFQGTDVLRTLVLHLPPETLHSGFSPSTANPAGAYEKVLRDLSTGEELLENGEPLQIKVPLQAKRVVSIEELATDMQKKLKTETFTSAEFGMELVAGSPKVRFVVDLPQK